MKKLMVLVLISSLFFMPGRSFALSCAEPWPVNIAYDKYDAVLIGSVEKVDVSTTAKKLSVEVEASYKGVDKKRITVLEDLNWGESQEGATYLFFLNQEGEKWVHPLCSPTTHNSTRSTEFLTDKEAIPLQEVKSSRIDTNNIALNILFPVFLVLIAGAGIGIVLSKRNKST